MPRIKNISYFGSYSDRAMLGFPRIPMTSAGLYRSPSWLTSFRLIFRQILRKIGRLNSPTFAKFSAQLRSVRLIFLHLYIKKHKVRCLFVWNRTLTTFARFLYNKFNKFYSDLLNVYVYQPNNSAFRKFWNATFLFTVYLKKLYYQYCNLYTYINVFIFYSRVKGYT